jgi:hypothetical protein
MLKYCFLAVIILIFVAFPGPAKAEQVNFTVDVTSGPESGDVFTGSFTYNVTALGMTGFAPLLSFAFSDPAWGGDTVTSTGFNSTSTVFTTPFSPPVEVYVFFAPGTGTDDAFSIDEGAFAYGTTSTVDNAFGDPGYGTGTVTYSTPFSSAPEPSSLVLVGAGLLGLIGVARRPFARG